MTQQRSAIARARHRVRTPHSSRGFPAPGGGLLPKGAGAITRMKPSCGSAAWTSARHWRSAASPPPGPGGPLGETVRLARCKPFHPKRGLSWRAAGEAPAEGSLARLEPASGVGPGRARVEVGPGVTGLTRCSQERSPGECDGGGIPANRFGFSRHRDTMEPDAIERQDWQIVQSWLTLRDSLL